MLAEIPNASVVLRGAATKSEHPGSSGSRGGTDACDPAVAGYCQGPEDLLESEARSRRHSHKEPNLKPILIAVVGCLLAVAAVVFVIAQPRHEAVTATVTDSPGRSAAPASSPADSETLARLDALDREIADLRAQLAAVKSGADRQPTATPAVVERETPPPTGGMSAAEHESVLKVIAEDRAEQKRKQDEERQQRDLQNALARADRAAQKYGLTMDQKKGLVDVFVQDAEKSNDLQTLMQQQGFNGDREAIRKAFTDLDTWRTDELTKRLGADLAQQVHDGEFNRFGGPRGGQRGNRNGGGPGQGG